MMTALAHAEKLDFLTLLSAPGRSAEIPESADAYGWLVGSWELDVLRYWATDVSARCIKGEAHFGWVLEGRAVQDVWIMPRCADRDSDLEKNMNMYGTTLRVWDPSIQAWRISWRNPAGGHHEDQIGRWSGQDVSPDRHSPRWHADAVDVYGDHTELIPLARRSTSAERDGVES